MPKPVLVREVLKKREVPHDSEVRSDIKLANQRDDVKPLINADSERGGNQKLQKPVTRPVALVDVSNIVTGSDVPGIPNLSQESDRQRRVCVVNATRFAATCVRDPNFEATRENVDVCIISAQQRFSDCIHSR